MSKERVVPVVDPDDLDQNRMYSTGYVAELFGVQVATVRDWIDNGRLPAQKIGRNYRVRRQDLINFANSRY